MTSRPLVVSVVCSPPSVAGFPFDRHTVFGMQPCNEEAMDTVAVARPPSVSSSAHNTATATVSSQLQSTTIAMDDCDGIVPSADDTSAVVQSNLTAQFSLPPPLPMQPGIHFRPAIYSAAVPCHVISQQPFSADAAVHFSGLTSGVPIVPSDPVSVPYYAVRQLPPTQPTLVQPHVYYRPADGFCVTTTTPAAQLAPLEQLHHGAERS